MIECLYGHGECERKRIAYTETRNGYVLVLQEVPAWVCPVCGEELIDFAAVGHIQAMLKAMDEQMEKLRLVA